MCIAIHKPAGVKLGRDVYEKCFDSNPDGAGFAWVENGQLKMKKGFFDFDKFHEALAAVEQHECVVHFRIASHGNVNEDNCHPWMIEDAHEGFSFAVIHNGILQHRSTDEKSDTGFFVDDILGPLLRRDPWFFEHDYGIAVGEKVIGSNNKIVILRSDGAVFVLNRKAGVEDSSCWFSNTSFRTAKWEDADPWAYFNKKEKGYSGGGYSSFAGGSKYEVYPSRVSLTEKENTELFERMHGYLGEFGSDTIGLSMLEKFAFFREEFIEFHPGHELLDVEELDIEILKSDFGKEFV